MAVALGTLEAAAMVATTFGYHLVIHREDALLAGRAAAALHGARDEGQ